MIYIRCYLIDRTIVLMDVFLVKNGWDTSDYCTGRYFSLDYCFGETFRLLVFKKNNLVSSNFSNYVHIVVMHIFLYRWSCKN